MFKVNYAGNSPSSEHTVTQSSNSALNVTVIVSGCLIAVVIASVVLGYSVYKIKRKYFKNEVRLVLAMF